MEVQCHTSITTMTNQAEAASCVTLKGTPAEVSPTPSRPMSVRLKSCQMTPTTL